MVATEENNLVVVELVKLDPMVDLVVEDQQTLLPDLNKQVDQVTHLQLVHLKEIMVEVEITQEVLTKVVVEAVVLRPQELMLQLLQVPVGHLELVELEKDYQQQQ